MIMKSYEPLELRSIQVKLKADFPEVQLFFGEFSSSCLVYFVESILILWSILFYSIQKLHILELRCLRHLCIENFSALFLNAIGCMKMRYLYRFILHVTFVLRQKVRSIKAKKSIFIFVLMKAKKTKIRN